MKIYNDFNKVLKVLQSCKTYAHVSTAEQMFFNFCKTYNIKYFDNTNIFVSQWDEDYDKKIFLF